MQRRSGESGNGARVVFMRYLPIIIVASAIIFEAGSSHFAIAANLKEIDALKMKQAKLEEKYIESVKIQSQIKAQLELIIQYVVPASGNTAAQ